MRGALPMVSLHLAHLAMQKPLQTQLVFPRFRTRSCRDHRRPADRRCLDPIDGASILSSQTVRTLQTQEFGGPQKHRRNSFDWAVHRVQRVLVPTSETCCPSFHLGVTGCRHLSSHCPPGVPRSDETAPPPPGEASGRCSEKYL